MTDDQQQPGQSPAEALGSWPPPADQTVVQSVAAPGAWGQPTPPPAGSPAGWAPQPGYPQPGYQQPAPMAQYAPPVQGVYPTPYGRPVGYPQPGYGVEPQYAGFWIRFAAYLVDGFILSILLTICLVLMLVLIGIPLFFIVAIGYFPYFWWKGGATPGMKMLGIRVVRAVDGGPIDGGTAAVRYIGTMINGWALGLGYLWAAFEPRKRGWHDMMANTVVIHIS